MHCERRRRSCLVLALLWSFTGCGDSSANDGGETSGPGDGDPSGPGDGDPSGPGDGDGDPTGDGDGDSTGDGDGDGDGTGDGDGDPPAGCGDGMLDPDEACDDGNNEPGDGCTSNCQLPGEPLWEIFVDLEGEGLDDIGAAVVVDSSGSVGVLVDQGGMFRLARFSVDGEFLWAADSIAADRPALARGAAGTLVVGGRLGNQGICRAWAADGTQDWTTLIPVGSSGVLSVATHQSGDIYAAGYHPGPNGFLGRYDEDGMELWASLQDSPGELGPIAIAGDIWAIRADVGQLERYTVDGELAGTAGPLPNEIAHDLAVSNTGDIYVLTEAVDQTAFSLSRFDPGGTLAWTQKYAINGFSVAAGAVGALPGGGALVVGTTNVSGDASDAVLLWYDLDGNPLADEVLIDGAHADRLLDLAVTPYNYAVAVGGRAGQGQDADLWIRKFGI